MTDDLIAFLKARLDEDEAAAKAAWGVEWDWRYVAQPFGERPSIAHTVHIARHDPARVLREVENDRELIARYEKFRHWPRPSQYQRGMVDAYAEAIRLRAQRFSDHPSFKRDWAFD